MNKFMNANENLSSHDKYKMKNIKIAKMFVDSILSNNVMCNMTSGNL